jgi:hypothetical protein
LRAEQCAWLVLVTGTLCPKPPNPGKSQPPKKGGSEILRRWLRITFLLVRIGKIRPRKRFITAQSRPVLEEIILALRLTWQRQTVFMKVV